MGDWFGTLTSWANGVASSIENFFKPITDKILETKAATQAQIGLTPSSTISERLSKAASLTPIIGGGLLSGA